MLAGNCWAGSSQILITPGNTHLKFLTREQSCYTMKDWQNIKRTGFIWLTWNMPIKLTSRGLCNCFTSGKSLHRNGLSGVRRVYRAQARITLDQVGTHIKCPPVTVLRTARTCQPQCGPVPCIRKGPLTFNWWALGHCDIRQTHPSPLETSISYLRKFSFVKLEDKIINPILR